MNVFWHQRDIRVVDNRGLSAAGSQQPVVPVFVYDSEMLDAVGKRQRAFLFDGVRRLQQAYRERGSDLLVREGSPEQVIPEVIETYDADALYYNEHYRKRRRERQHRVESAVDVPVRTAVDRVLVDPATLDSQYSSHSQFHNDWQERPKPPTAAEPEQLAEVSVRNSLPTVTVDIDLPRAGHDAARERWESFLTDGIQAYRSTRDDLDAAVQRPINSVSRLSPYLATGMIGIREVYNEASDRYDDADEGRREIEKYRYELSWREQNYHLLYHNPALATENYKHIPNPIEWRDDETAFVAWKRGRTGYPLVDAGMRQLNQEGYLHNRPRQVVASFLCKHLLIDWRRGERYFREQLVDYDPASNAANWQWIASTGTDSVDVRIFDPVSQMAKYDADAEFVTAYVPELRGVDPERIVDWPTLSASTRDTLAPTYSDPIVDRDEAYERAQRVYERALGKR